MRPPLGNRARAAFVRSSVALGIWCVASGRIAAATIVVAPNGNSDKATIQDAIDTANPGDIIELLDGTFAGVGNRDLDFHGKAITVRSQSGHAESCIIDCEATSMDPHRGFVFENSEGAASILADVRVMNGLVWERGGGAVLCAGASPTLRRVEFVDSHANFGGGLACLDAAAPVVEACRFTGNRSDFGSGAACHGSSPTFTDCRFADNLVAEIGGGLLCEAGSQPTLTACTFENNFAEIGAGLACRDDSNPQFERCRFVRNRAEAGGGEGGGAWCANSSPTFTACLFESNVAFGHGGALTCVFASPKLDQCTLYANASPEGGGIFSWLDSAPSIERSIVAFSIQGEAVACNYGGTATLSCSDLYGNTGGDWTNGAAGQLADPSNFSADPRFCDASFGVLHLWADSPCLGGKHPNGAGCGTVGAFGTGCTPMHVENSAWSRVKSLYRDPSRRP